MDFDETADPKSPAAILFHQLDARQWLPAGKALASAVTVAVSPPGALLVDQCSADAGFITYRVRGGVAEADYIATFSFTTDDGSWVDQFSVRYPVR
jgi:hypothetical protein